MEPKSVEQYEVTPVVAAPVEPTIDDESRRLAFARAMIENEKHKRSMACIAEIDAALAKILEKYNCTLRPTFQVVALDEQAANG